MELPRNNEDIVIANPTLVEPDLFSSQQTEKTRTAVVTDGSKQQVQKPLKSRVHGIALMAVSSFVATTQGAIFQYLNYLPTGLVLMIVCGFSACFLGALVVHQGHSLTIPRKLMPLFIGRNIFTMLSFSCRTWSFQNLPLGNASALVFTMPLFTGIFARIFLKEKYTIIQVFCTLAGFGGILLVAKPTFIFAVEDKTSDNPSWYPVIALTAAVTLAAELTIQRRLGSSISSIVISFYMVTFHFGAGLIYQIVFSAPFTNPPCFVPRVLLVVAGICSVIAITCVMRGLALESASTATLIKNLDTVLAFIAQVTIFGEPAGTLSLVGASLIILATVTLTLAKMLNITCGIEL